MKNILEQKIINQQNYQKTKRNINIINKKINERLTIKREFVIITTSIEVVRIVTVRQAKPEFMAEGLSL